jgi:hypothetical protein
MVQDLDTDKVTHIGNPHIINQLEKGGDFGELGLHDPHNKRQGTIITREKVNEFLVIDKVSRFALFVAYVFTLLILFFEGRGLLHFASKSWSCLSLLFSFDPDFHNLRHFSMFLSCSFMLLHSVAFIFSPRWTD